MKLRKLLKNPITKTEASVKVAFGKPVCTVPFGTIKFITTLALAFLMLNILYSLKLFHSSIHIKNSLGDIINMISRGDGHILPSMQALPTLIFLILNVLFIFFVFKLFKTIKQPKFNWILFILIIVDLVIILITFVLIISILSHSYSSHEELHNGITVAMRNYSSNSLYKMRMDRLQIEFNCCGSKKYDEWYNITWYDEKLSKAKTSDNSQGNTPFSCCSMTSIFPCIHHNIESTGKVYLYTPEQNLSISTDGCYNKLRKKKQKVGWQIVGNLFLMQVLQLALLICLRFLQTGHYVDSKFSGHSKLYTIWLIGMYAGKIKDITDLVEQKSEDEKIEGGPPEPPPIPPELKE